MGETHGHRWQFPRYILPDGTSSSLPPTVAISARLRLPDAQRWGLTPVAQGGQRTEGGQRSLSTHINSGSVDH